MTWFQRCGLRVLMYHKISSEKGDALTVTTTQLAEQLTWLIDEGFEFLSGWQVLAAIKAGEDLPSRSVLLTFDDAYLNNHELAFPLLVKFQVPAVLFVPTAWIGQASSWDSEPHPLMDAEQLKRAVAGGIELGLHSHHHVSYRTLTPKLLAEDLKACVKAFDDLGLPYLPALAYPFGHRPEKKADRLAMFEVLENAGVQAAFRIGNRVNPVPLQERFEINRLGVRGDRDLAAFQRQVNYGRWF